MRISILFIITWFSVHVALAQGYSLEQCLDSARHHNVTLQNAALDIQSAKEQKKEAFTKFFPQISATVNAFHLFDELANTGINRGYTAMISVAQPLYAGGQIVNANKLANVGNEVAVLQHSLKEKEVLQKVTENFWKIAELKYNLNTLVVAEKQVNAIYKRVNDFVEAGVTTRNALLRVRLRQQELESNRIKLENALHVMLMLLAEQIGVDDKGFDINVGSLSTEIQLPAMADAESVTNGRTELQLAAKAIEAKQLQVKLERGKNLPTLALGITGVQAHPYKLKMEGMDLPVRNGVALLSLSIPITQWWGGSHAVRRSQISLQQAKNDYANAQRKLRIDIEQTWSNLTEAYRQIQIARTSVEEAEENLRMANDQYSVGKTTITELLEAETLNRQALDRLSTAIADYNVRLSDYKHKTDFNIHEIKDN